jgi:3'-phosphoadenosine 5'-phosphosulfate sulfotransferase (PAPS reductase)/FAD synthetase
MVPLGELRPNPRNPNGHPKKQIKLLAKIFSENGIRRPITVSRRSGLITVGHGRLYAAQLLKLDSYPVDYQDYESDEHEMADMLADNRIPELASMDIAILEENKSLLEVAGFDLEIAGFEEKPPPVEKDQDDSIRLPFGDKRDEMGIANLLDTFDFITCMFSGGKDSIATVLYLIECGVPKEKITLFCSVTPMDPPHFDEYIKYCVENLGIGIMTNDRKATEEKFLERLAKYGYPGRLLNWCNTLFKVETFKDQRKKIIANNGICVIGNRAEESARRSKMTSRGIWDKMPFVFPIFDFTTDDVRSIMLRHNFMIHPVYRFDGRMSCMQCYNQGAGGWASLRKNFPAEYQRALEYFKISLQCQKFRNTDYCIDLFSQMISCEEKINKDDKFDYPEDMIWSPAK